jgi:hypothetical protein
VAVAEVFNVLDETNIQRRTQEVSKEVGLELSQRKLGILFMYCCQHTGQTCGKRELIIQKSNKIQIFGNDSNKSKYIHKD